MLDLNVRDLNIIYGAYHAVKNVSFTAEAGEFVTLLGPSGCGKTTTLSAIAGLIRPTSGSIALGESYFFKETAGSFVVPEHRGIGLVFQSYALWPHMTVKQNLEFPLKIRKLRKAERDQRIDEILDLVEMKGYAERYAYQLSGGQQQRVALARTLVYRPPLALLDEPLSNLDAKLRDRARIWIRDLQSRLKLTTVYVTHDQTEALAMSDRIAVMNNGRIVQFDKPENIYRDPADPFVASFIGRTNFLSGVVRAKTDTLASVELSDGSIVSLTVPASIENGARVVLAVRPEVLELAASGAERDGSKRLELPVQKAVYVGPHFEVSLQLGSDTVIVYTKERPSTNRVAIDLPTDRCRVFPGDAAQPS